MALQLPRRRFTVDEYHQMAKAGILAEDDRIELVEGEIIQMAPIGYQHASAIYRLTHLFVRTFGDAAVVGIQNPVRLSDDNEPEPDLTLLRPQSDFYGSGPVGPSDVYLAVEVSDSSLRYDRQVKIPLYARNGIPEAWLIDLNKQTITVYRDPAPAGYTSTRVARRGEQLASAAFPDRVLEVDDILG